MIKKLLPFTFGLILPRRLREEVRNALNFSELRRKVGVEQTMRRYLLYFLMPLWMGAGLLDWYHHRRTKIEKTAGTRESMIHILMMSEIGLPIMVGLFIEVNPFVLAMMIVAFFLHEATAYWDVSYAVGRRDVTPSEQHVHSFLELIPFMAVSFMICLYWDQFLELVKVGKEPIRFELRAKRQPLARNYVEGIVAATAATVVLPYAEEFWRCYRVDHTVEPHPVRT